MGLPRRLFARVYDRRSLGLERLGAASHRQALVAGLEGRVVDVGAGNGLLFAHLPPSVAELVAVEPEPYLRSRAIESAAVSPVKVAVVAGTASELPLPDASCDAVVCSLVLCSVPSLPAAVQEIHRVLRPGGELRFYEHVVSPDPRLRRWQRLAGPIWFVLAGGCHLTRDTVTAIGEAGFDVIRCDRFVFRPARTAMLTAPHVLGAARR